jgi:hypothetical protein
MKIRRAVIAAVLFVAGMVAYLSMSGAPLRVQMVSLATDFCLVAIATYFTCATSLSPRQRMIGVTVGVVVVSVITTWLSSKVIASLTPLEPIYFGIDLVGSAINATVIIGVVWLLDFVIELLMNRRAETRSVRRAGT